ncbi:MAG TPA: outer membrane protein assembly factor BamD [Pyrinomonadaceae bacterium]|nr:outer membrane protein assembly factor BamD [Pyrinomonadaceae bacterium]
MRKILFLTTLMAVLLGVQSIVYAQGGAKQGPQASRDLELDKDSLHNLEVARHYFKLKKAYVAALQRCEEIKAANPTFYKIDEVLYIAGESSLNLAAGKGRQKPSLYVVREGETKRTPTPDEFRDMARDYFSQLVNSYPESSFRGQAEDALRALGGPKPKSSGQ